MLSWIMDYRVSFLLCGLTSFISYHILKTLGDAVSGRENMMITYLFNHISSSNLVMFFAFIATCYLGLFFSIVTTALFSNLVSQFSNLITGPK